jgi:flavin reductase (DIM6/NTAB) family NADH-FMN oxidoreductase RutF
MQAIKQAKRAARRLVFGASDFSQQCTLGLPVPQGEVAVWLEGLGKPRDVTQAHFMACGAPFLIGIGDEALSEQEDPRRHELALTFAERKTPQRVLGSIALTFFRTVSVGEKSVQLFRPRSSRNYCLPGPQLWAHYLQYAYLRRRSPNSEVTMTARDVHGMCVFYICPRPTGLVSVCDGSSSNVFPMNLMGGAGGDYFCFALKTVTPVVSLVQRAGRLALCSLPVSEAPLAYRLGRNHNRESVDRSELAFATRRSPALQLPIPEGSVGVKELHVERSTDLGSHTLFVARILHEERWGREPQFFLVHGMYDLWRRKAALA